MGSWGTKPKVNGSARDLWDAGGSCDIVSEKNERVRCAERKVERVYTKARSSGGSDAWNRAGVLQLAMEYGYKPTPKIAQKAAADLSALAKNKEWLMSWDPDGETAVQKNIKKFSARVKRAAKKG